MDIWDIICSKYIYIIKIYTINKYNIINIYNKLLPEIDQDDHHDT